MVCCIILPTDFVQQFAAVMLYISEVLFRIPCNGFIVIHSYKRSEIILTCFNFNGFIFSFSRQVTF